MIFTCFRNLDRSIDVVDLVELVELWAEPSMHTQNLIIDNRCDWEAVEAVGERLPDPLVVPPSA